MTIHISVRLAWHDSGWNGHICRNLKANTYCIRQYFYQRDMIIRGRDLSWEHLGMLHDEKYRNHWDTKRAWYEKHGFADRLITTQETDGFDSKDVLAILEEHFGRGLLLVFK